MMTASSPSEHDRRASERHRSRERGREFDREHDNDRGREDHRHRRSRDAKEDQDGRRERESRRDRDREYDRDKDRRRNERRREERSRHSTRYRSRSRSPHQRRDSRHRSRSRGRDNDRRHGHEDRRRRSGSRDGRHRDERKRSDRSRGRSPNSRHAMSDRSEHGPNGSTARGNGMGVSHPPIAANPDLSNMKVEEIFVQEEEEEDVQAKLEALRKRRQKIVNKHVSSATTTPRLEARPVLDSPAISTTARSTSPGSRSPSPVADDEEFDVDLGFDDEDHQHNGVDEGAASKDTATAVADTMGQVDAPGGVGMPVDEDGLTLDEERQRELKRHHDGKAPADDVPDMFSADFEAEQSDLAPRNSLSTQNLKDNWDDEEGYYRVKLGEMLHDRYKVYGFTGQGVFSNVVRARDTNKSDVPVAVKVLRNNRIMYKAGEKELEVLTKLRDADPHGRHHCVLFLDSFVHRNHFCLVFENLAMNLREVLKKYGRNRGLNLRAVQSYAHQLLLSLRLLKKCKILHADIKPDNILVNEAKNLVKLCDFGSASFSSENDITPYLASRFYRAPEIMLGLEYSYGIDMWAMACTIFEIATGKIMFKGRNNNEMLKFIMDVKGRFPARVVRKGQFRDDHFTADNKLMYREIDKVTKNEKTTMIDPSKPPLDLMALLVGEQKLSPGEKRHMVHLRDLLDKMLMIDPEKRIGTKDALRHPFIVEKIEN